jgi:type II secretory pathway pseudopilin PulG
MRGQDASGYSLLEMVFAMGLMLTVSGIAVPEMLTALDEFRTAGAARYISSRLQRTRMEAVSRSVEVAMQFSPAGSGYAFAVYVDGNHNGVLTRDVQRGVDPRLGAIEHLGDNFVGVDFGALPGLPPVDSGRAPPGEDPIRLGSSNLAAFAPAGTATPGSLYIRGRRSAQYVVRIFGDTGKTRVLKFQARTQQWRPL